MKISKLNEEHIPYISEILENHLTEHEILIDQDYKRQITEQLHILCKSSGSITLVATINNRAIGYINGHLCSFPLIGGVECYITELFIHPDFRGQKIGKKLLDEIERQAKSLGCKRIMLNNAKTSEAYETSFYKKNLLEERTAMANFVKKI